MKTPKRDRVGARPLKGGEVRVAVHTVADQAMANAVEAGLKPYLGHSAAKSRKYTYNGVECYISLLQHQQADNLWVGVMRKAKRDGLPLEDDEDSGTNKPVSVGAKNSLSDGNPFLFDPKRRLLIWPNIITSLRPGALASYLTTRAKLPPETIEFHPSMTSQLLNSMVMTPVEVRKLTVAGDAQHVLPALLAKTSLSALLANNEALKHLEITIKIKAKKGYALPTHTTEYAENLALLNEADGVTAAKASVRAENWYDPNLDLLKGVVLTDIWPLDKQRHHTDHVLTSWILINYPKLLKAHQHLNTKLKP